MEGEGEGEKWRKVEGGRKGGRDRGRVLWWHRPLDKMEGRRVLETIWLYSRNNLFHSLQTSHHDICALLLPLADWHP